MTTRANETDRLVGRKVRAFREALNFSQADLAKELGITFQQIQKYEKGLNRISAGRLAAISDFLKIPIQNFFNETDYLHQFESDKKLKQIMKLWGRLKNEQKELLMGFAQNLKRHNDRDKS